MIIDLSDYEYTPQPEKTKYGRPGSSKIVTKSRIMTKPVSVSKYDDNRSKSQERTSIPRERPQRLKSKRGSNREKNETNQTSSSTSPSPSLPSPSTYLFYEDMDKELRNALRVIYFICLFLLSNFANR